MIPFETILGWETMIGWKPALLIGIFCGTLYLCTVLTIGRRFLPAVTVPIVFALWYPASIFWGVFAFVFAGISAYSYQQIEKIQNISFQRRIPLILLAIGLLFSFTYPPFVPLTTWWLIEFMALSIFGTVVLYPLIGAFVRGERRANILFLGASAALLSTMVWGWAAGFGEDTTITLVDFSLAISRALSPFVSHMVRSQILLYAKNILVTFIFLVCIILADSLFRFLEPFVMKIKSKCLSFLRRAQ